MATVNKRLTECIAARGSYTSDNQEFSSYPFAFDRNCPFGVSDKEIIDENSIKVCQPHLPPFQNQYTVHSHFQDLFLAPDCPSCIAETNSICNKTSNLNNNPQILENSCLIVDPMATQFASIPLPVCIDSNTIEGIENAVEINNNNTVNYASAVNPLSFIQGINQGQNQVVNAGNFISDVGLALLWILIIFGVLMAISYLAKTLNK